VKQVEHRWYARPVFYVADIQRSITFYVDLLGFQKQWHEAGGTGTVCQVHRSECEIILCQDASRQDRCRLYVELTAEGLVAFRRELTERAVPSKQMWWGSDCIQVDDPDGNELVLPLVG